MTPTAPFSAFRIHNDDAGYRSGIEPLQLDQLSPGEVDMIGWLPPTCAYRLVRDGEDLYWWHPLVSGDPETVHIAGISAKGRTVSEEGIDIDDYEDYLVTWPMEVGEGK